MLPASNRSVGTAQGFPDTCNTPNGSGVDVPTPYTNSGDHSQATGYSSTVYVTMANALSQSSTVSSTSGDESGTSHSTTKGTMSHTCGNPIVYVDSVPAVNVSSATSHNKGNCPAGSVVSPGAANVFYTYRSGHVPALGSSRPIHGGEVAALSELTAGPTLRAVVAADDVLSVRFEVLAEQSATELLAALSDAERRAGAPPHEVRIDLRGVPGGTLEGAARLLSVFLPEGAELFRVRDLDGDVAIRRSGPGARCTATLVVLIDGSTGSAAEVVVAALVAHGRAIAVGSRTAGKASAQVVTTLAGQRVYRTVATIEAPFGTAVDGVGVEPSG